MGCLQGAEGSGIGGELGGIVGGRSVRCEDGGSTTVEEGGGMPGSRVTLLLDRYVTQR